MIDEQDVAPATASASDMRRWARRAAAAAALVALVAGFWLFTPHLTSDQDPDAVGEIPRGAIIALPSGTDADPAVARGRSGSYLGVTNTGALPVILSEPRFGELTGTAGVQSAELGLSAGSASAPYATEVRLEPGEQASVLIRIYGSECSDSGSSESLTTIEDVILRAQVGPFARNVRLSAWATMQVVTEDGSALPPCP